MLRYHGRFDSAKVVLDILNIIVVSEIDDKMYRDFDREDELAMQRRFHACRMRRIIAGSVLGIYVKKALKCI